jgi:hypothetical protein
VRGSGTTRPAVGPPLSETGVAEPSLFFFSFSFFNFFFHIVCIFLVFYFLFLMSHSDTCQFLKGIDVDFHQFMNGGTISIFSHK